MRSVFVVFVWLCFGTAIAQGAEPIWPTQGWQTSTPEEQGMDPAELAKLVAFGELRSLDSLVVVRHGRIVLETYYGGRSADVPHVINSATKAVISTLIGIALKDGTLDSLDRPMLDFFSDSAIENIDEGKKAITIQTLLDSTSGIDWQEPLTGPPTSAFEMMSRRDWVKFVLDRPMSNKPGETFNYNSGGWQVLSAIITKLTSMDAADYAKAKLFAPLGISTPSWRHDPQGHAAGGFGLSMLTRDMAKIGYLYLHNGEWQGKKLLPSDWVDKPLHATVDMKLIGEPDLRYSNAFWALPNKHAYMAVGYHCQIIMVLRDQDIVAAMTARNFCPFSKMVDDISSAVKSDAALPQDPVGTEVLTAAIRKVSSNKSAP